MAHYKRGKCRYKGYGRRDTQTFWRARRGLKPVKIPDQLWRIDWNEWKKLWPDEFSWTSSSPRWHDILYHNRPRRHRERIKCSQIVNGSLDADEVIWPLEKKPHHYYW